MPRHGGLREGTMKIGKRQWSCSRARESWIGARPWWLGETKGQGCGHEGLCNSRSTWHALEQARLTVLVPGSAQNDIMLCFNLHRLQRV